MTADVIIDSGIFLICLILSAFFSASEVALFSLQQSALEEMSSQSPRGWKYVVVLLQKPRHLLVTILIGNTVVTTAAAVVSALLTIEIAGVFGWRTGIALPLEVIAVTF